MLSDTLPASSNVPDACALISTLMPCRRNRLFTLPGF